MSEIRDGYNTIPLYSRAARAGLAVLTVVAIAACRDGGESDTVYAEHSPAVIETEVQTLELPDDWPACKPSDDPALERLAAEQCLEILENGSAALVTFDMQEAQAEVIAGEADRLLREATNGRIQISTEVVPASPEAQEAVEQAARETGCVDSATFESWTSRTADRVMNLDKYDYVIGMTGLPACEPYIAGIANLGGRYGEVFASNKRLDSGLVAILGHERGHQHGFGHEGVVLGRIPGMGESFSAAPIETGRPFDLAAYLRDVRFKGYGGSGIMGHDNFLSETTINEINLAHLYWPEEVLTGETIALGVGAEPVVFNKYDVQAGRFGHIRLDGPAAITVEKEDASLELTFGNIVLVPKMLGSQPQLGVIGADVFLENSSTHDSVFVGGFADVTGPGPWTIKHDETVIEAHIDADRNLVVSAKPAFLDAAG